MSCFLLVRLDLFIFSILSGLGSRCRIPFCMLSPLAWHPRVSQEIQAYRKGKEGGVLRRCHELSRARWEGIGLSHEPCDKTWEDRIGPNMWLTYQYAWAIDQRIWLKTSGPLFTEFPKEGPDPWLAQHWICHEQILPFNCLHKKELPGQTYLKCSTGEPDRMCRQHPLSKNLMALDFQDLILFCMPLHRRDVFC